MNSGNAIQTNCWKPLILIYTVEMGGGLCIWRTPSSLGDKSLDGQLLGHWLSFFYRMTLVFLVSVESIMPATRSLEDSTGWVEDVLQSPGGVLNSPKDVLNPPAESLGHWVASFNHSRSPPNEWRNSSGDPVASCSVPAGRLFQTFCLYCNQLSSFTKQMPSFLTIRSYPNDSLVLEKWFIRV